LGGEGDEREVDEGKERDEGFEEAWGWVDVNWVEVRVGDGVGVMVRWEGGAPVWMEEGGEQLMEAVVLRSGTRVYEW
jgi:hypothetical protein